MNRKLTIEVVEDEALVALNLIILLEDLGHIVLGPAATSTQALTLAEATPPDLAFVDLNLVDGPTGVRVARDLAERFGTLVVVVSATPDGVREGENGVFRVITKPYRDQFIIEAVERAAARKKGSEARAEREGTPQAHAVKGN